jgi:DNA-binding beta-propeller fold protein YncE
MISTDKEKMMARLFAAIVISCTLTVAAFAQGNPNPQANAAGRGAPAPLPAITTTEYDVSSTWFTLPPNMELGQPLAVAADGKGNLYLLRRRAEPPIVVLDRQGKFIRSFGEGLFSGPHSIDVDRFGFIWATDNTDNTVYKFSADGKVVMTLGKRGTKGDNTSQDLFDGPSDVFVAANGDLYVTDGYRNSRLVKFDKDGNFLKIIGGTKGKEPGQFDLPHAILMDSKGRLIVTDRNNGRIQVFDQDGKFLEQWADLGIRQPSGLYIEADDTLWVGDNQSDVVLKVKSGKIVETINGLGGRPHLFTIDQGILYQADSPANTFKRIKKK